MPKFTIVGVFSVLEAGGGLGGPIVSSHKGAEVGVQWTADTMECVRERGGMGGHGGIGGSTVLSTCPLCPHMSSILS